MAKNSKIAPVKKVVETKKEIKTNNKPEVIINDGISEGVKTNLPCVDGDLIGGDSKTVSPGVEGELIGGYAKTSDPAVEGNLIGDSSKIDEPVIIKSATLYDEVENITEYASPGVEGELIGGDDKIDEPIIKNVTLEEEPEDDEEEINGDFEEKPEIKISDLNPNQMRFYLRTGMLPK